jgi:UDP-N-acetylglucosamine transferase subunit ALG13
MWEENMIFVTVGTHEQQFNRLIQHIDELKKELKIEEEVIMQIGFCTYIPQHCQWKRLFPYQQMLEFIRKAHIVITHGGPSSIMMVLQEGKHPIVVPRQKKYNEHVNNHQLEFVKFLQKRQRNIIVAEDIESLEKQIIDYILIIQEMNNEMGSNNTRFNIELEKIVNQLFRN